MWLLGAQPKLVELVQDAVLADIAAGKLAPGTRLPQEDMARDLGVSRPRLQEALQALCQLGVLCETEGLGLQVAPLDPVHVSNIFEVRAVIEGLAFRMAAERSPQRAAAEGPPLLSAGRQAVARGNVADMVEADLAFHEFVFTLSCNPLLAPTLEQHDTHLQRIMGGLLQRHAHPEAVWDQHEAMLQAVIEGDGDGAERLARIHIQRSAERMIKQLRHDSAA